MLRIFISYRRDDSRAIAGRIYDRLVETFGRENVFKDVDRIPPGSTFAEVLEHELDQSDVALLIIGKRWASITDQAGLRRLDDAQDFVRLEAERALARPDLLVIPILVDDAAVPTPAELPDSMDRLASLQAVPVRHDPDFHRDMDRLIEFLRDYDRQRTARRGAGPRVLLPFGLAIVVFSLMLVGLVASGVLRPPTVTPPATLDPYYVALTLAAGGIGGNPSPTPNMTGTIAAIMTGFVTETAAAGIPTATSATLEALPTEGLTQTSEAAITPGPTLIATPTPATPLVSLAGAATIAFINAESTAVAQQCSPAVRSALIAIGDVCNDTRRNQVCYGAGTINANFRRGAKAEDFDQPGDIIDIENLNSLDLTPLRDGISAAVLRVVANVPNALPGETISFLLISYLRQDGLITTPVLETVYFTSGVSGSVCREAPSNLFIISPEGETVPLEIQGAEVQIG
ncbi:MAG: TIR domain-containing protein [Chloroflexi bacterium]|nr:TIR domain-containing protein [Chloroflexota bacterium]